MANLLRVSEPTRRRPGAALWAGVVAGVLSALVKLGWEQLLPPRTPDRMQPPVVMLDRLGVPTDAATFSWSGQSVNWSSLLVHVAFSVAAVVVYALVAEYLPGITVGRGAVFGLGVWVVFHLLVLPALGLTPPTGALPFDENVSEALGHVVWLVAAELVRSDVRRRRTGEAEAEAAPVAAPAPAGR